MDSYGSQIILPDQRLMEIKVPGAFPMWMTQALSELQIRRISFSKYGRAYKNFVRESIEAQQEERKIIYA